MGICYFSNNDGSWLVQYYKNGKSFHHNHKLIIEKTTTANHYYVRGILEI